MADKTRTLRSEFIYIERAERLLRLFLYNPQGIQSCIMNKALTSSPNLSGTRWANPEWRFDLPYEDWDYDALFHYFVERSGTVMKKTWSLDRVSLVFYFIKFGHPAIAERIRSIGFSRCYTRRNPPPGGLRTGAKTQKHLPPSDFEILASALTETCKSPHALFASDLLRAILLMGLRPCEWFDAKITDETETGEVALVVVNAKKGNGRTHGITRTLYLTGMPRDDRRVLLRLIWELRNIKGEYEDRWAFQEEIKASRRVIGATAKRLWPDRTKRPNLYSARHQFAANLKFALFTKKEIAALMGHATDATATHLYARRGKGSAGGFLPGVEAKEVANIREVYNLPDFIVKKRPLRAPRFDPSFGPSM